MERVQAVRKTGMEQTMKTRRTMRTRTKEAAVEMSTTLLYRHNTQTKTLHT